MVTLILAVLAVGLYTWGAASSVVINGHIYATTSDEAKAWRLTERVKSDAQVLIQADTLLGLTQSDARARIDEYVPAAESLESMVIYYDELPISDVPTTTYGDMTAQMKTASFWGAQALRRKIDLIRQPDARAESDVNAWRGTFQQSTLSAAQLLVAAGQKYGIVLGPSEGDKTS